MSLSVVIVNWNSGDRIDALLEALAPMTQELKQVLVVDNASRDGSAGRRRSEALPVLEVLRLDENQGFAGAANLGIEKVGGDWVLLLNPDVVPCPTSVRRLMARGLRDRKAAILCGPLIGLDGRPQRSFQLRPLPTWRSVLSDALFLDELSGALGLKAQTPQPPAAQGPVEGREVDQPAAAYWLLRREAWRSVGGFDQRFHPAWFEDVDLCRRLGEAGWRLLYFADCPARHEGGYSVETTGRRRFLRIYYRNELRYLRKHHPRAYPWLWAPVKLGLGLRLMLAWVRTGRRART